MKWDVLYVASRSATIQFSESGTLDFVISTSFSGKPRAVSLGVLAILSAFSQPRTATDALAKLDAEFSVGKDEFAEAVTAMLTQGVLIDARNQKESEHLLTEGFASPLVHHLMLRDLQRVYAYRTAIARHARGKRVLEIGCGSGVLSCLAAKAGATHVIAIEETSIASMAKEMFIANGCASVVDLRIGNSLDIAIDEPVDVIIHELIGNDPLNEGMIKYIEDAKRRFLRPGGRLIPSRIEIACIGVTTQVDPDESKWGVMRTAEEYSKIYGLSFAPLLAAIAQLGHREFLTAHPPDGWRTAVQAPPVLPAPRQALTEEAPLHDIDLTQPLTDASMGRRTVRLVARRAGMLGGVLLHFRAYLDDDIVLTNAPSVPPTHWSSVVVPLPRWVEVKPGDEIVLNASIEKVAGFETYVFELA